MVYKSLKYKRPWYDPFYMGVKADLSPKVESMTGGVLNEVAERIW